jgi:hypothetical protein
MPEFRYSARNAQGQLVDGTLTANDPHRSWIKRQNP